MANQNRQGSQDNEEPIIAPARWIIRDPTGRLRVREGSMPPMLADWLETDVRTAFAWCDHLLAGLAKAKAGEEFEATGNLYHLVASGNRVEITNIDDPAQTTLRISNADATSLLRAWRKAILLQS